VPKNIVVIFANAKGMELIKSACKEEQIDPETFEELVETEIEQTGKQRKVGLWSKFDDILDRILEEDN